MSKPQSVAKASPLTHQLMKVGYAKVAAELRHVEAGFSPRTTHDVKTMRRMLVSIQSMMDACTAQRLH